MTQKERIKILTTELHESNDIIRSFMEIIKRKGIRTNWEAIENKVAIRLSEQHKVMYPDYYNVKIPPTNKN